MRKGLLVLLVLAAGLWGCSTAARGPSAGERPEENRFTKNVLVEGLDEPMALEFDSRGRVYWIERKGAVKRLDEATGQVTLLGTIPVAVVGEAGLIGILLDEAFETSRHLYLYYSAPGAARQMHLSRFKMDPDDRIDLSAEIVMLRWPHDVTSHMGGGMVWDAKGNLYLSTGDNSEPTQYTPIHWTNEGGRGQDAQRSAANTNDLRGKILRIHPEPDGTYTIPEGNLFAPGTPDARPEIYTMGNRNPWRLSIDARTGYLHWGEIGPDAGRDSAGVGPMGYDEFNVARSAGNFGWPYFIGYNRAYHRYDNATHAYGPPFDPERPVNASPNNTGRRALPLAQPALIAYPYGVSEEYPMLSSGGRCAVGGPVFHRANFKPEAARLFPAYYEGTWFVADFVRNWIMAVTLNEESTAVVSVEPFLPDVRYSSPLDVDFGPEGDLYLVEYGLQPEGRLSKIEYNGGNRAPNVVASADKAAGATPLRVALSSAGTVDYDGDDLRYAWVVTPEAGGTPQRFTEANPTVTLHQPGTYKAVLTVTDASGAAGRDELAVVAGNEPPKVTLEITRGNRSFYFPEGAVAYQVKVSDREDGSLGHGIAADAVQVTAEYVPSGITPAELALASDLNPGASVRHVRAFQIIGRSDCSGCHSADTPSVGPAFEAVAARYRGQADAVGYLSQKIIEGGSGVWGETPMPAHPTLAPAEAATLAEYVLSLAEADAAPQRLPVAGTYPTPLHVVPGGGAPRVPQTGAYVLRAAYTDRGAGGVAPITADDVVLLRYPQLAPETADVISPGITYNLSKGDPGFIIASDGAYIGFKNIDLTGIGLIEIGALTRFYTWSYFVGATAEVRLDSPTGRLISPPVKITPPTAASDASSGPPGEAPAGQMFLGDNLEPPVPVEVSGVTGRHDVYLVFSNAEAGADEALLLLTGIGFKQNGAPAPRAP